MVHCEECGNTISDGDEFCLECGTRIEKDSTGKELPEFCVECGEVYTDDSSFCVHCGLEKPQNKYRESEEVKQSQLKEVEDGVLASVVPGNVSEQTAESNNSVNNQTGSQETDKQQKPKKPMSKWKKFVIIASVFFLALIFGTYKYLENYFDPMKDLVKMDEAMLNNDVDGFMEFVEWDKAVPFDKEAYFSYIKDYEWDNGLKDKYYALIEAEKESPTPLQKELSSQYDVPLLKVKDSKVLFGLFKGYILQAVPVRVSARSNLEHTEINLMDKEFVLEEADEYDDIGTFYPGVYEIEATTKTDFGDFDVKGNHEIKAEESSEVHIDFNYEMFSIDVDYEYYDAILYVDGENTKKMVSDLERIGPIPLDSKVKVHAEWHGDKNKVVRSNTVQLDGDQSDYVYLEFDERIAVEDEIDEDEHEVAEFILSFRTAYEDAVNYADYDYIAAFMKPGSEEEKDLKKFVKDMDNASYYYEFEENTIANVKKNDDKNYAVETNEQFTFYDEDGSVYEYDRAKMYFVEVIDGDYKVHNIDYKDTKKNKIN